MSFVRRFLRAFLGRAGRALLRAERSLVTPEAAAAEHRITLETVMAEHDRVDDPDEAYYAERYWEWLEPRLPASGVVLDAGCGSGRIAVPIAQRGLQVVGVDFLAGSVERARRHAAESGVEGRVELVESDLLDYLGGVDDASFDAVVFLEVGFVIPQLAETMRELARVLRPGGRLLASLRAQWFLAALAVRERDWEMARIVRDERGGALPGMGWQNWSAREDLLELVRSVGLEPVGLRGLGAFSGVEDDPMAALARPSQLSDADRAGLAEVETGFAETHPDLGRYILVEAVRPTR
ncbi:MAG: class I SAM-dependent methyltransferase [Gaiellaceae bacterium]